LRFTASDESAIARVAQALVAAGAALYALEPEGPSLEDVYFALHHRERQNLTDGAA
jgi:hypothetical protein